MLPRFENGIKIIFLFLLTNVSSRSYSNQKQKQDDRGQLDQVDQVQLEQLDPSEVGYTGPLNSLAQVQPRGNRIRAYSDRGNFLSRLLDSRQGPVVVFLTPGTDADLELQKSLKSATDDKADEVLQEGQYIPIEKSQEEDDLQEVYVPQPGENDAYVLYNVLRTTQEDEDLDPEADKAFEITKDVLRSAFALRCGARNSCEKKCPQKKPSCPVNCQKVEKKVKNECKRKCPSKRNTCEAKCEKIVEKKVDECEQKVDECEEKQEKKCESRCQKVFDELDSCSPPKPKKCGPKCGKTMPPPPHRGRGGY